MDSWIRADSDLVVVFVHGTFHADLRYDEDSASFISEISGRLPALKIDFVQFSWSSNNLYSARIGAAKSLANYIEDVRPLLEEKCALVLIGHSHGGNVAMEAIRIVGSLGCCDRQVICLGTPLMLARAKRDSYRLLAALGVWIVSVPAINVLRDGAEAFFLLKSGQQDAATAASSFWIGTLAYVPPLLVCFGPLTLWMILFAFALNDAPSARSWEWSGISDAHEDDAEHFNYFFDSNDEVAGLFRALNVEESIAFTVKVCTGVWIGIVAYFYLRVTLHPSIEDLRQFAGQRALYAIKVGFLQASYVVVFYGIVATSLGWLLLARILTFGNRRLGVIQDRLYSKGGAHVVDLSGVKAAPRSSDDAAFTQRLITIVESPYRPYLKVLKIIPFVVLALNGFSALLTLGIVLVFGGSSGLGVATSIVLGPVVAFLAFMALPKTRRPILAFFRSVKAMRAHPHTKLKGDERAVHLTGELLEGLYGNAGYGRNFPKT